MVYGPQVRVSQTRLRELVPLQMHYVDVDPGARYRLRVVYAGDRSKRQMRLVANHSIEVHPDLERPQPIAPWEFALPAETTREGQAHAELAR